MKTLVKMALLAMVVVLVSGCAGNRNVVVKAGESIRHDVFKEATDAAVTPGKAVLLVEFPHRKLQ